MAAAESLDASPFRPRCPAENNRNPISATGQTLTLGTDGKPIDKTVEPGGK